MISNDPSAIFLFSEYAGPSYDSYVIDKDVKDEFTNMYEERIKEFLNTWFIFSCKCNCCNKEKTTQMNNSASQKSATENAFMNIFGSKYYNNVLQYMIPRFLRFRHIIKVEQEPSYSLAFEDYIINSVVKMKKVISKSDDFLIRTRYKEIYMFYEKVINKTNEELMTLFDEIVRHNVEKHLATHSYEEGVLPFIEESMFYNNSSYDSIREKALVIFFEIVCRFFDNINVDIYYSTGNPTKQFLDGFFKIQKVINVDDIFYFFLRDSKSVLVYDLQDKLKLEEDSDYFDSISDKVYSGQKYTCVDKVRHIYLLSFDSKIMSMVYSDSNAILFLENGSIIANGSNENSKILYNDVTKFNRFVTCNYPTSKNISYIKIYDSHIIIRDVNNNYLIYGNLANEGLNELYSTATFIENGVYINENYLDRPYFTMSDNENNIQFYDVEEIGKVFAFDEYTLKIVDNSIFIQYNGEEDNHEVIFNNLPENASLSNIFKLKNGTFIVEFYSLDENNNKNYFDYSVCTGPKGSDNVPHEYEIITQPESDEGNGGYSFNSHYIDLNDQYSNHVNSAIKQVISTNNKTIILFENGLVAAYGINEGHFISFQYDLTDDFQIISNELPNHETIYTGMEISKSTSKSLIILYKNDEAIGYGGYHFLGMKHGSTFRTSDEEVIAHYDDETLDGVTNNKFYSYFCTKNCLYFINPIFDLIATGLLEYIKYKDEAIGRVIGSLLYMKDMSVTYNEEAYEHIINNLTLDSGDNPINSLHASQRLHSNLQNFLNHDSVLLMYGLDDAKYNSVSKFINLIGLIAENFMAMKTTKCKLGNMEFNDFLISIEDINRKSVYKGEEKEYGIKFNPFRGK